MKGELKPGFGKHTSDFNLMQSSAKGKREDAEKTAQQASHWKSAAQQGWGPGLVLPAWLIQNVLHVVVLYLHV